jgi:hypothetical protein
MEPLIVELPGYNTLPFSFLSVNIVTICIFKLFSPLVNIYSRILKVTIITDAYYTYLLCPVTFNMYSIPHPVGWASLHRGGGSY